MERLLDAEIFVNRNARSTGDSARHVANQRFVEARARTVIRDRHVVQRCEKFIAVLRALANVIVTDQIFLDENAKNRRETESVGAGTHPQMVIRHICRFGAARIDHYQRAARVGRNCAQNRARALKAMRLPWILADEYRDLRLLVASAKSGPEKLMVHPKFAGLFLR